MYGDAVCNDDTVCVTIGLHDQEKISCGIDTGTHCRWSLYSLKMESVLKLHMHAELEVKLICITSSIIVLYLTEFFTHFIKQPNH